MSCPLMRLSYSKDITSSLHHPFETLLSQTFMKDTRLFPSTNNQPDIIYWPRIDVNIKDISRGARFASKQNIPCLPSSYSTIRLLKVNGKR